MPFSKPCIHSHESQYTMQGFENGILVVHGQTCTGTSSRITCSVSKEKAKKKVGAHMQASRGRG